ncbi:MAG: DUF1844 domain-containing protein [Desulfobacterales bacterium]
MSDKQGFTIKDRRVFSQETPDAEDKQPETERASTETQAEPEAAADPGTPGDPQEETQLPEINFSTFVMSLNASALVNLGILEDPGTHTKSKNLPVGKQTIDILAMLEDRTRGNLSEDEAQMLKDILYELRMLYVKER